jgi:hypothetical protein
VKANDEGEVPPESGVLELVESVETPEVGLVELDADPESELVVVAEPAVVVVVEEELELVEVVVVVVDDDVTVTASASSSEATFNPAVTSAGVAGAAPRILMSDCPVGPRTNRMNWASLMAFAEARLVVGTTR